MKATYIKIFYKILIMQFTMFYMFCVPFYALLQFALVQFFTLQKSTFAT